MFYGAIGIFVETEKQTSPKAEGDEFPLTIIEKLNYHFPMGSLLRVQVFFTERYNPVPLRAIGGGLPWSFCLHDCCSSIYSPPVDPQSSNEGGCRHCFPEMYNNQVHSGSRKAWKVNWKRETRWERTKSMLHHLQKREPRRSSRCELLFL